jgi:phospholipase C
MSRFYEDAAGDADSFPDYCFIEPSYFRTNANDDHPPHNTMHAQCLIADVYNALRKNTRLWQSSLLVILYDEHGGFFDHIEPEPIDPPDEYMDEYTFNRLGVRVPALLISPWAPKGVNPTRFDHTSLLKYVADKWQLGPLYNRVANANSIGIALEGVSTPRPDILPEITDSPEMAAARREPTLPDVQKNGNQIYLLILSDLLSTLLDAESRSAKMMAAPATAASDEPLDEVMDAKRTVELFIQQETVKPGGSG